MRKPRKRLPPPRPSTPSPADVSLARANARLTAAAAGDMVCVSGRAWTNYESGRTRMNGALWRYFCMVTCQFDFIT
ncbi:helix-turn-helix domain-containing protein [Pseudomonas sp.]|jgi:hypothetical protein|uniref:helix-turn-helix domain-containing protein n=1 Tax=Pseudomonas sp. TaxID=306 RepID=UPI002ED88185